MNWLQNWLTENVGLKLLSVALAIVFWAALGSDPVTEAVFQAPVEFSHMPPAQTIMPEHTRVQLLVRGPSREVRRADPTEFSVTIDLSSVKEFGEQTYFLSPSNVEVPESLEVVQVVPAQVRFRLERTLVKEVPIQPRFSGEGVSGHRVKQFRVEPSQAKITGPQSRVEPIAVALTDPVDLDVLSGSTVAVTRVYVPDPWVQLVSPETVEVSVELEKTQQPAISKTQDRSQ